MTGTAMYSRIRGGGERGAIPPRRITSAGVASTLSQLHQGGAGLLEFMAIAFGGVDLVAKTGHWLRNTQCTGAQCLLRISWIVTGGRVERGMGFTPEQD
jgi:hypothetical protein